MPPAVDPGPLPAPGTRARAGGGRAGRPGRGGAGGERRPGWPGNADAIRPLVRGKEAPDFVLPRIDGQPGHAVAGQPAGARSCCSTSGPTGARPCVHMMPTLHGLQRGLAGQGRRSWSASTHGPSVPEEEVRAFLRERPAGYPMVMDADGRGERPLQGGGPAAPGAGRPRRRGAEDLLGRHHPPGDRGRPRGARCAASP